LNSQSSLVSLLSAEITDVHHHTCPGDASSYILLSVILSLFLRRYENFELDVVTWVM
jgi:hypothetical protein